MVAVNAGLNPHPRDSRDCAARCRVRLTAAKAIGFADIMEADQRGGSEKNQQPRTAEKHGRYKVNVGSPN
jgi:hypothetical protein